MADCCPIQIEWDYINAYTLEEIMMHLWWADNYNPKTKQ